MADEKVSVQFTYNEPEETNETEESVVLRFENSDNDTIIKSEPFKIWKIFETISDLDNIPLDELESLEEMAMVYVRQRFTDKEPYVENGHWVFSDDLITESVKSFITPYSNPAIGYYERDGSSYWRVAINETPETIDPIFKDYLEDSGNGYYWFLSNDVRLGRGVDDNGGFFRLHYDENSEKKYFWDEVQVGSHSHENKQLLDELLRTINVRDFKSNTLITKIPTVKYDNYRRGLTVQWVDISGIESLIESVSTNAIGNLNIGECDCLPETVDLISGKSYLLQISGDGKKEWVETAPVVELSESAFYTATETPTDSEEIVFKNVERFNSKTDKIILTCGRYFIPEGEFTVNYSNENKELIIDVSTDYYFYTDTEEDPLSEEDKDPVSIIIVYDNKENITSIFDTRYVKLSDFSKLLDENNKTYATKQDIAKINEVIVSEKLESKLKAILEKYSYRFASISHRHDGSYAKLVHHHDDRYMSKAETKETINKAVEEKFTNEGIFDTVNEFLNKFKNELGFGYYATPDENYLHGAYSFRTNPYATVKEFPEGKHPGNFSFTAGFKNTPLGKGSGIFGKYNTTNADSQFIAGENLTGSETVKGQVLFGQYNEIDNESIVVIGGGSKNEKTGEITEKNVFSVGLDGSVSTEKLSLIDIADNSKHSISVANGVIQGLGNLKGEKGDQGPQGPQGINGEKGEKGEKGDPFRFKTIFKSYEEMIAELEKDKPDVFPGEYVLISVPMYDNNGNEIKDEYGIPQVDVNNKYTGRVYMKVFDNELSKNIYVQITDLSGAQGIKGEKGDQGPQGIQGIQGEVGPSGKDGEKGADGETPFIKDNNWWIGETDTGILARGTDGEKGEKGDKGDKGDTGEQGDKGADGHSPYVGENGNWWRNGEDLGQPVQFGGDVVLADTKMTYENGQYNISKDELLEALGINIHEYEIGPDNKPIDIPATEKNPESLAKISDIEEIIQATTYDYGELTP